MTPIASPEPPPLPPSPPHTPLPGPPACPPAGARATQPASGEVPGETRVQPCLGTALGQQPPLPAQSSVPIRGVTDCPGLVTGGTDKNFLPAARPWWWLCLPSGNFTELLTLSKEEQDKGGGVGQQQEARRWSQKVSGPAADSETSWAEKAAQSLGYGPRHLSV